MKEYCLVNFLHGGFGLLLNSLWIVPPVCKFPRGAGPSAFSTMLRSYNVFPTFLTKKTKKVWILYFEPNPLLEVLGRFPRRAKHCFCVHGQGNPSRRPAAKRDHQNLSPMRAGSRIGFVHCRILHLAAQFTLAERNMVVHRKVP